ncbi:uncharacterized protein LOC119569807 isoform X2 [Penaeus monodon]|uniref:uncharacterized protein LOC119569807 isoform X2 n=1 Tax=Penaeus monodon TaxID=6687 RepID=UPI0018A6EDEF|nr:uncharacterized protein LOC119569807 isoform X2 [Penaeus monodon]
MCLLFLKCVGLGFNLGLLMQLPVQLQLASPAAREWITRRRENVRPWLVFVNTQKFKVLDGRGIIDSVSLVGGVSAILFGWLDG